MRIPFRPPTTSLIPDTLRSIGKAMQNVGNVARRHKAQQEQGPSQAEIEASKAAYQQKIQEQRDKLRAALGEGLRRMQEAHLEKKPRGQVQQGPGVQQPEDENMGALQFPGLYKFPTLAAPPPQGGAVEEQQKKLRLPMGTTRNLLSPQMMTPEAFQRQGEGLLPQVMPQTTDESLWKLISQGTTYEGQQRDTIPFQRSEVEDQMLRTAHSFQVANQDLTDFQDQHGGPIKAQLSLYLVGRLSQHVEKRQGEGRSSDDIRQEIASHKMSNLVMEKMGDPKFQAYIDGLVTRMDKVIGAYDELEKVSQVTGERVMDRQYIASLIASSKNRISPTEARQMMKWEGKRFSEVYNEAKGYLDYQKERKDESDYDLGQATRPFWMLRQASDAFNVYASVKAMNEGSERLAGEEPQGGALAGLANGFHQFSVKLGEGVDSFKSKADMVPILGDAVNLLIETAGHITRTSVRLVIDALDVPLETLKGLVGSVAAGVRWITAESTGNAEASDRAFGDFRTRLWQTAKPITETGLNVAREMGEVAGVKIAGGRSGKVDFSMFNREEGEFELFDDNFVVNLIANSLLDPLNYVLPGVTAAGQLQSGSLFGRIIADMPDVADAIRSGVGVTNKLKGVWSVARPSAISKAGYWARITKEAKVADAAGDVLRWRGVKNTATKLARVTDQYGFLKLIKASHIPDMQKGEGLRELMKVFGGINLSHTSDSTKAALWGRILTHYAADGILPQTPGRVLAAWAAHPRFQQVVDWFSEQPVGRTVARWTSQYPSMEEVSVLQADFPDLVRRANVALQKNPAYAMQEARRVAALPMDDKGEMLRRLALENLNKEARGAVPSVRLSRLEGFLNRYSGFVPEYELTSLRRQASVAVTQLEEMRTTLRPVIEALPDQVRQSVNFKKILEGTAEPIDYLRAINRIRREVKNNNGAVIVRLASALKVGDAAGLTRALDTLADTAGEISTSGKKLLTASKNLIESRPVEKPFLSKQVEILKGKRGSMAPLPEKQTFAFEWDPKTGVAKSLTNPAGDPVPVSLSQMGHLVRFDSNLAGKIRAVHPKDIFHASAFPLIERAVLQDFSNIANYVTSKVLKRIWLGRPSYVVRSWITNMTKLFMWGYARPDLSNKFNDMIQSGKLRLGNQIFELDPKDVDVALEGLGTAKGMPLHFRKERTHQYYPGRAMQDPMQAVNNALHMYFLDDVGLAYMRNGRGAALEALRNHPRGLDLLKRWGIDDFDNADAYFDVWDKMIRSWEDMAPATFDALKYYSGSADDLGRAASAIRKKVPEGESLRLSMKDVVDVMLTKNEDFIIPLYERRLPLRSVKANTKAGKSMQSFLSESDSLYSSVFGSGIRATRSFGYRAIFMDITQQLLGQDIPLDKAVRIAASRAVDTVNDLLMDFARKTIWERQFEWMIPFADDMRIETFSYMKQIARRPHIGGNISRLFRGLQGKQIREGRPGWSAYSVGIPWGGSTKWVNIPQYMMYPELQSMVIPENPDTTITGMLNTVAQGQLGPIAGYGLQALTGGRVKPQFQGLTQYDKNIVGGVERYHAEQALKKAEEIKEVKSGEMSKYEWMMNSAMLSEGEKRTIGNRVTRSMHVWQNENPGAAPTKEQIDGWVQESIESLSPTGGVLAPVTSVLGRFMSMPGAVYDEDEMRAMGEQEKYWKAAGEPGEGRTPEQNALLGQHPGLVWDTYKPQDENRARLTPYETVERVAEAKKRDLDKDMKRTNDLARDLRQMAFPGQASEWGATNMQMFPERETSSESLDYYAKSDDTYARAVAEAVRGERRDDDDIERRPGDDAIFDDPEQGRNWLAARGYDENGEPTDKLLAWRSFSKANLHSRQQGGNVSWYEFIQNLRDEAADLQWTNPEEYQRRMDELSEWEKWSAYPDQPGTSYNEYLYQDPQRKALTDQYWAIIGRLSQLRGKKERKLASDADLALIEQLQAQLDAIEQQIGELPQPNLSGKIYPFAPLTVGRKLGLPLPGAFDLLGKVPFPVNTKGLQQSMLEGGILTPEQLEDRKRMPTPAEQDFQKMPPTKKQAYLSALVKITSAKSFSRVELTKEEAMALSGKTAAELQKGKKGGLGDVFYADGIYTASNFPVKWLDERIQERLQKFVDKATWQLILSRNESGGSGKRYGGWTRYSKSKGTGFAGGSPTIVDEFFALPKSQRTQFLKDHPELREQFRARKEDESDADYAERLRLMDLAERYYGQPSREMRYNFLATHPELLAYFEAQRTKRDRYWLQAMARAFVNNPQLWEEYLRKQMELSDIVIATVGRRSLPKGRETQESRKKYE
ncbi:MAG: hypothetical protein ACYC3G_00615 [Minisyncoccota bacterium]